MARLRLGLLMSMLLMIGAVLPAYAACPAPVAGRPLPREAIPEALDWPEWRSLVNGLSVRLRATDVSRVRIAFLGDSITQSWHPNVFQQFYGHRGAVNLGIGGDTTQGMLWRLENGHWPTGLQPEAIVLLIGTNNIGLGNRPEDVALGVGQVIGRLQRLAPKAKILLLGVLPRGIYAADRMRQPIARLNQMITACGDNRRVFYADPGPLMLDGQGVLFDWVAYDWLHLTMVGYAMLSTAIEPSLRLALRR